MALAFAILAFVCMAFVGGIIIGFIMCDLKRDFDTAHSEYNEKLLILESIKLQNNLRFLIRDEIRKEKGVEK